MIVFSVIWILILGIDYLNKHPWYGITIEYFKYGKMVTLFSLGALSLSLLYQFVGASRKLLLTGSAFFLFILICLIMLAVSFSPHSLAKSLNTTGLYNYMMMVLRSFGYLVALSVSAYLYGSLFRSSYLDHPIVKIAFGTVVLCMLFFVLSALWLLSPIAVGIVLVLPVILGIKQVLPALRGITVKGWSIDGLNGAGFFCLLVLIAYVTLNFAYTQSPFPVGFDSRNFYMNIAHQVADSNGLVFGYRPYNWELLIATGYTFFDTSPVALSVSFYGYILTLFAMFYFGVKTLKLNPNMVLFCMLLFTAAPAMTNQLFIELKTDFGLLFIQLITLSIFLNVCKDVMSSTKVDKSFRQRILPFALLGILVGFGLGIKMTNMFLLFALIISLFWMLTDHIIATFGVILLTMALFILVRLDDLSGVRAYHLDLNTVFLAAFTIGAGLLVWAFIKQRAQVMKGVRLVTVMGVFSVLTLSPWLIKNFNETQSIHPKTLLNGAPIGPGVDMSTLQQNYLKSLGQ